MKRRAFIWVISLLSLWPTAGCLRQPALAAEPPPESPRGRGDESAKADDENEDASDLDNKRSLDFQDDVETARGATPERPDNRWALLVGINKYKDRPLRFCAHDMEVLRDALIKHGGYDTQRVRLLSDAVEGSDPPIHGTFIRELKDLLDQAQQDDSVLVAFAGHGGKDPKEGRSYLLTIDAVPSELELSAIKISDVVRLLEQCRARQKLLILDCCHAAGGVRGEDDDTATDFDPDSVPIGRGIVQISSCTADQKSWEDPDFKQGVFSYFLAKAIRGEADLRPDGNENGLVSIDEVFSYTHARVVDWSRQKKRPGRQTPKKRGDVEGELIVASSRVKPGGATLPIELIADRLIELEQKQVIHGDLAAAAREWLTASDEFAPARQAKLLLSLLAKGAISSDEFYSLLGPRLEQLQSNVRATKAAALGKLRAVVVGINDYEHQPDLAFAVSDARRFAETLSGVPLRKSVPQFPASEDIVLLFDAQATEEAVVSSVRRLVDKSTGNDRLVIYFAGSGIQGELESGAWLLTGWKGKEQAAAPKAHRGLERADEDAVPLPLVPLGDTSDDALPLFDVARFLRDCRADVLIVSDACETASPWDDLPAELPEPGPALDDDDEIGMQPARVFIGMSGPAFEPDELKGGVVTYLIIDCLRGKADVNQARYFADGLLIGRAAPTPTARGIRLNDEESDARYARLFAEVLIADRGILETDQLSKQLPDGFVTLRELTARMRVNRLNKWSIDRTGVVSTIVVQGTLGSRDVVLTRSTLPVD